MKIEYTRDLNHNYMIVHPVEREGMQYALRILETQPVEGTVPMEVRHVNGQMLLYYRIDGLQSLEHLCLVKKLRTEDIQSLCRTLCAVTEGMKEYLLDEEHLYLSAETIFYDRASERWFFAPDPFANGTVFPESFGETLICCADEHDEAASAEAYRIATLLGTQGMRLSALLPAAETAETAGPGERKMFPEGRSRAAAVSAAGDWYRASAWEEEEPPKKKKRAETEATEDAEGRSRVLTLLCAIATLAGIYLRREYVLSAAGNVLTIVVIAVGLAGFAASLVFSGSSGLRAKLSRGGKRQRGGKGRHKAASKKRGKKRKNRTRRHPAPGTVEALFADPLPGMEGHEKDILSESYNAASDARHVPGRENRYPEIQPFGTEAENEYTRLLQPDAANVREAMLYSRSAACNRQIALEQLPFTVGKGSPADITLPEESVSRTHAWLNRDASGDITLRDLNSTNGTFRNGIRLKPGEEITLSRGDEIRFGNLVFEYL